MGGRLAPSRARRGFRARRRRRRRRRRRFFRPCASIRARRGCLRPAGTLGGGCVSRVTRRRRFLVERDGEHGEFAPRADVSPSCSRPGRTSTRRVLLGTLLGTHTRPRRASDCTRRARGGRPRGCARRRLADAFGVSDPDRRPSAFAASAAEAFTREVFATAKAHPAEVAAMEHALERLCVDTNKRRISLEPMPRRLRAVAHALGKTYGAASCSYGEEPYRRVDYFRSDATGFPSIRLSDAILADRRDGSDPAPVRIPSPARAPPPRRSAGMIFSRRARDPRDWAPPGRPVVRGFHRTLLPATLATPRDAIHRFRPPRGGDGRASRILRRVRAPTPRTAGRGGELGTIVGLRRRSMVPGRRRRRALLATRGVRSGGG